MQENCYTKIYFFNPLANIHSCILIHFSTKRKFYEQTLRSKTWSTGYKD